MSVSSISSASTSTPSGGADVTQQVQQIQKQIQALQKDITKENASSDAAKTKQEVVQEYQLEIVALELQMQQIQQRAAQQAAVRTTQQTAVSPNQSASQSSTDAGRIGADRYVLNTTA
jgi:pimeloyl-CoA synthetase